MRLRFLMATWLRGARTQGELRQYLELIRRIRVVSGPFSGMHYVSQSCGSAWSPKILGTYELEIASVFRSPYLRQFEQVIDIGCAEGYYLAGIGCLLRRLHGDDSERVGLVGYDSDPRSIALARELSDRNQLKVELHPRRFRSSDIPEGRNLYIVDIEGDELHLLDSLFFEKARVSDVVVEIHEQQGDNAVMQAILEASSRTHQAVILRRTERRGEQCPKRIWLPVRRQEAVQFMEEHRKFGNAWVHLKSHAAPSGSHGTLAVRKGRV